MADYNLLSAATKVKAKRVNFGFYQGDENLIYISGKPVGSPQIKEIDKVCGENKRLFKGLCFKENEKLVFATKSKPSMVWEVLLTKCLKDHKCGRFLPIDLRQLKDGESDEVSVDENDEETTPTTPTAPSPADDAAALRQLKAEVTPRVNSAIRDNPASREELFGLVKQGLEKEKTGAFSEALSFFRQLEKKLPPAPTAAGAPPPPPPGAPPPAVKPLTADQLSKAMENLMPRLQQAAAAQPGRQAEIQALGAKLQAALRDGKLGEAQAALMEGMALVRAAAPADPAEAKFAAAWSQATTTWTSCVDTVDEQIEKVRKAMQGTGDPDFLEIADRGLAALTDNHKTPVMVAVRNVAGASSENRRALAIKAREAIASFRSHIQSDERVAACDEECEGEFGVKLTIRSEITRGLDSLDQALSTLPTV